MQNYSVLMSVYYKENPEFLRESIESMINQTIITNDFVIIEDGMLTEKLEEVIKEYEKKYSRIFHVIRNKENKGLGLALKQGVLECKNELIARIDSDDISVKDRCEKQLKKFKEDEDLIMVGSNHIEFIDNVTNIVAYKELPSTYDEVKKYIKRRNPFSHSAVMYKKSFVLNAGNYRDYHYLEDYDLWTRMVLNDYKCENINDYLSYVRVGEDLYKRRGGLKYLKSILKFKTELYKKNFYSLKDYIITTSSHVIVCLLPSNIRKIIYENMLRKRKE